MEPGKEDRAPSSTEFLCANCKVDGSADFNVLPSSERAARTAGYRSASSSEAPRRLYVLIFLLVLTLSMALQNERGCERSIEAIEGIVENSAGRTLEGTHGCCWSKRASISSWKIKKRKSEIVKGIEGATYQIWGLNFTWVVGLAERVEEIQRLAEVADTVRWLGRGEILWWASQ